MEKRLSMSNTKTPANRDQSGLKRNGKRLRERLAANPAIYAIPVEGAELWALGEFMSAAECEKVIAMIDACAKPSTVFDLDYSSGYRTSYSGDVDPNDPFIKKLNRRVNDLLGIEPAWGETIQGQRYLPGQQFQPHNDFFYPDTSYWEFEMARGGQRSITAMVFLNDVEEGGHTEFTQLGISIEPRQGTLLIWNNATPDGVTNEATMHAGRPVTKGVKYVLTKWYRTMKWN